MLGRLLLALLLACVVVAGCGDESEPAPSGGSLPGGPIAAEGRGVLAGVRYRVVLARQLNLALEPDRSVYRGPSPGQGRLLYMVILRACNVADEERAPTEEIALEDAFGARFAPLPARPGNRLDYRSRPLAPGRCVPPAIGVAAQTLDGAALVFELPVRSLRDRPLVVAIEDDGERLRLPANPPRE